MQPGFAYLVGVMDCYSRYVLSWTLSNTQDANVCAEVYREALSISPPEIFHSDQGSQYKSAAMTSLSKRAGIRSSMCGRGRCYDNILIERLWRSVKYEEVYLREYVNLPGNGWMPTLHSTTPIAPTRNSRTAVRLRSITSWMGTLQPNPQSTPQAIAHWGRHVPL